MNTRKVRKQTGISQMRLAKAAGISRYRLSLAECGYLKLDDAEARRLATILQSLKTASASHKNVRGDA